MNVGRSRRVWTLIGLISAVQMFFSLLRYRGRLGDTSVTPTAPDFDARDFHSSDFQTTI